MFKKIGQTISTVSKAAGQVSKIAGQVSKIASHFADIGGKRLEVKQKPMSQVMNHVFKFVGEKVNKRRLEGEFFSRIGGTVGHVVKHAGSLVSAGSLGSIGFMADMATKAKTATKARTAPKVQNLTHIAQTVSTVARKVGAFHNSGRLNFQHIIAQAHASIIAQNHVRSLVAK